MWKFVFVICVALFINVDAHVQLLYPPATLNLDFLDNFRTSGICGHEATGVELTEQWRLPEVDNTTVTSIQTGSNLTVNWALHYAHQGGWLFELYNANGELTSTWNSTDHWDCTSDSTQQEAILRMPDTPCEGCILRLRRQALEWGAGYRFHSCALVDIVDEAEDACNGCSGNGRCVRGSCECFNSTRRGFWYGEHCERQNECEVDEHCGEHGVCVDSGNITPPNKQCYCREGYFGSEGRPIRGSDIAVRTCTRESNLTLGDPTEWEEEYDFMFESPGRGLFQLFYTLDQENEEIEFAIRARTQNWVAIGFRPIATGSASSQRSGQSTDDAESEGATEDEDAESEEDTEEEEETESEETTEEEEEEEVESEGRRRSLKHVKGMPQIQQERESVTIQKRAVLQSRRQSSDDGADDDGGSSEGTDDDGGNDDDDSPAPSTTASGSSSDEETEAEGKEADHEHEIEDAVGEEDTTDEGGAAEGDEDGAAEGEGDDDVEFCEDGSPTTTVYDEGLHDLATPPRGAGKRRLKSFSMPLLQVEKHQSRTLKQDQDDNEDDESTAEGEEDEEHDHDDHDHEDEEHDHDDEEHDHEDHDHEHEDADGEGETADEDSEGEGEENEETESEGVAESDDEEAESEGAAEGDEEAESEDAAEGDEEAESEGVAEGDGDDEEDEEYIPELIAEGTECEAEAVDPGAHPMINQDVILAYAKDGIFRIQDSFTPSRAKPLPDSFFGGDDGIIDAIGSQTGQFTNIKFRRKLTSLDGFGDYCILPEVDYWLIYAFGQDSRRYSHDPPSGLETGRASNERFYGEDELKYHGGGIGTTYEGRGSFGSVNFFEEAPTERATGEGCLESTMEDYECMMEALGGDFIVHWTVEDDGVTFACETSGTGWVGIGWPETPGVMIGSQAVIGLGGDEGSVSTYVLEAKAPTGITQDNALFEIEDEEIETSEESSVLRFKRLFDDEFDGEGEIHLVVAFHATSNEIEYHGTTRGAVTITLS